MSREGVRPLNQTADGRAPGAGPAEARRCPLPGSPGGPPPLTAGAWAELEEAGCPLAPPVQERLRFETLLAELSATFVNLPAREVDAQIESALRDIVRFLQFDRGGLAELFVEQNQLVITHSYHEPGIPLLPRVIQNEQLPWYAKLIQRGKVHQFARLPDDLPADASAERAYCTRVGLKSHLMIPLKAMDAVLGGIVFGSFQSSRDWPEELVQRLRLVGEIFANALARKRADEALQSREQSLRETREGLRTLAARLLHAQEEERRRVAREMHDDWTQRLAVLGIDLAKLESHLGSPPTARPLLHAIRDQVVELSEDVHALSRHLHPSILDDLGLVEAVRSECASFSRREGIAVRYHPEAIPAAVPRDVALCIYRVTQEALRNVAKHAAVKEARVRLGVAGGGLELRVQDGGVGFDPAILRTQPGLGLSSMQERVRLIQAELDVVTAPGQGTTVKVLVPLDRGAS